MERRGAGWAPTWIAVVAAVAVTASTLAANVPVGGFVGVGAPSNGVRLNPDLARPDPSWDNGVVRLAFTNPFPSFTVTSDSDGRIASAHALAAVAEVTPAGNVSAIAPFDGANLSWKFAQAVGPSTTEVWVNATVPVTGGTGEWESEGGLGENEDGYGGAHVSIVFYLNASTAPSPDAVRFTVNVTHWPWLSSRDSLGLEVISTAVASTAFVPPTTANQLVEQRVGSSTPVATLSWDAEAVVRYPGGVGNTSTVDSFSAVASGGHNSTLRLQFGQVSGGYQELSYDPTVQLNLAAFQPLGPLPAWQASPQSYLVLVGAGSFIAVLAVVAWRNRSLPSPPP